MVVQIKKICLSVMICFMIIIVSCSRPVHAAKHYVSPNGSASWAQSVDINTPCSTSVAFTNAQAGDTVYFRGGFYTSPKSTEPTGFGARYMFNHSGTASNPIVFMAYPGEVPLFNGTGGGIGDKDGQDYYCSANIFGANRQSYLTIDGFSFQADSGKSFPQVMLSVATQANLADSFITVKNCIFNGGINTTLSSDNHSAIFISEVGHCFITNCKIFGYKTPNLNHNISGIKDYHCFDVRVENCEIYNCTGGIYLKSDSKKSFIRNNFLHDNNEGILVTPGMVVMNTDSLTVSNNLIVNNTQDGFSQENSDSGTHGNDYLIYNNTFCNNGFGGTNPSYSQLSVSYTDPGGHGHQIYNNIFSGSNIYSMVTQDASPVMRNYLKAIDHNEWGTPFKTIRIGNNYRNSNYATLAEWQSSGQLEYPFDAGCGLSKNPGCGDLLSDPGFLNVSGKLSQIGDFKLASNSPCIHKGRNGLDNIGANTDIIGTGKKIFAVSGNPQIYPSPTVYADSVKKKIQWEILSDYKIIACSLFVSFDTAHSWRSIATVSGDIDTFLWRATDTNAAYCLIKVTALNDSDKTTSGVSSPFKIINHISIQKKKLSTASVGRFYLDSLVAESGIPPCTWSIETGYLPASLYLDPFFGTISGIPHTTGRFPFLVKLSDAEHHTAQDTFSIIVDSIVAGQNLLLPNSIMDTVAAGNAIVDTLVLKNDTLKLTYSLFANRADKPAAAIPDTVVKLSNGKSAIIAQVPASYINDTVGERAFIVVSNGTISDTLGLSHPVRRSGNNSDNITVGNLNWTPLSITATPASNDIASVLSCFSSSTGSWSFDKTRFRIIQWYPYVDNSTDTSKWVEATQRNMSIFNFTPGKVFWIKSNETRTINFGAATVPAMNVPVPDTLNARQWTDFSIPFDFPVSVNDVILETKVASGNSNYIVDSLDFYQWTKSGATWTADLIRGHGISVGDTMYGGPGNAYTVYNPNASFAMQIPPACIGSQVYAFAGKKATGKQDGGWTAGLDFQTGNVDGCSPVYVAYIPGNAKTSYLREPPGFGKSKVTLYDPASGKFFGHAIVHDISGGGTVVQLAFHNGSNSAQIMKSFPGKNKGLRQTGYSTRFYDPDKNLWSSLTDTFSLAVPENSTRIVVAGIGKQSFFNDIGALFSKYKTQLTLVYPNPCANRLMVKFTLPYLVYDVKEIDFRIMNIQGRTVWTKRLLSGFVPGENSLAFDRKSLSGGKLAGGVYLLRMNVVGGGSGGNGSFTRQISFVY